MEQAFKTFSQQMNAQNNPFGNAAYSPSSPFPFPLVTAPPSDSSTTSTSVASQPVTVDIPVTKVEEPPPPSVKDTVEREKEPKKYGISEIIIFVLFAESQTSHV